MDLKGVVKIEKIFESAKNTKISYEVNVFTVTLAMLQLTVTKS